MSAFVGIDVDPTYLVCNIIHDKGSERCKFSNQNKGFEQLLARSLKLAGGGEIIFGCEATSSYHKLLHRFLDSKGIKCRVFNPRQIRRLADGLEIAYKNDKVDAKAIAECLELQHPKKKKATKCRSAVHDELRDLSRRVQQLTALKADDKKRLHNPVLSDSARESIKRTIKNYTDEIKDLRMEWLELVKKDAQLKQNYDLILSITGIGVKTAIVLVSELDADFTGRKPKQVCGYAGLAPNENSSSVKTYQSKIQKAGNAHIRLALFMPATLFLSRNDSELKAFYDKLLDAGMTHKQAIVAVMRKLALYVGTVLCRRSPWVAKQMP